MCLFARARLPHGLDSGQGFLQHGCRQVIIREVFTFLLTLMYAFLHVTGEDFEKKQRIRAARGESRTYPVLVAAEGKDVEACMQGLLALIWRYPLAVLPARLTVALRIIRFTMISAALCTLHVLLRVPRQACPYRLFTALRGHAADLLAMPKCLRDSLAHVFLERFAARAALEVFNRKFPY